MLRNYVFGHFPNVKFFLSDRDLYFCISFSRWKTWLVLSYVVKEDSVFNTTVNEIFSSGLALSVET
jgi:hypothetical protein